MHDPTRPRGPRIIAIANQKGGVGKTTTAINLGAALAESGARVLLIDIDPQGNASTGLGLPPSARRHTTYDLILDEAGLDDVIHETKTPNLWIAPATTDLSSADIELVASEKRSFLLHDALRQPEMDGFGFHFILIDCPPSLSLLTVNAMVAAHSILVPLAKSEFFAFEGLSQLMLTVREVRQSANRQTSDRRDRSDHVRWAKQPEPSWWQRMRAIPWAKWCSKPSCPGMFGLARLRHSRSRFWSMTRIPEGQRMLIAHLLKN